LLALAFPPTSPRQAEASPLGRGRLRAQGSRRQQHRSPGSRRGCTGLTRQKVPSRGGGGGGGGSSPQLQIQNTKSLASLLRNGAQHSPAHVFRCRTSADRHTPTLSWSDTTATHTKPPILYWESLKPQPLTCPSCAASSGAAAVPLPREAFSLQGNAQSCSALTDPSSDSAEPNEGLQPLPDDSAAGWHDPEAGMSPGWSHGCGSPALAGCSQGQQSPNQGNL